MRRDLPVVCGVADITLIVVVSFVVEAAVAVVFAVVSTFSVVVGCVVRVVVCTVVEAALFEETITDFTLNNH